MNLAFLLALLFQSPFANPAWVGSLTRKPIEATGPNTYYYTTETPTGNNRLLAGTTSWNAITIGQSGTLTKLGIQLYTVSGAATTGHLKIALYSGTTTLIANGIVNLSAISATPTWFDVTGLSVAVTAGTYNIAFNFDADDVYHTYDEPGGNVQSYATQSYAAFPEASLPTADTWTSRISLRAFVE